MHFHTDHHHYSYQTLKNSHLEKAGFLIRAATLASVISALVILVLKFIAWLQTDSVAVFSSLIDAGLDLVISLINFAAARYALKPPDEDHKFGHGKAEDIAALLQTGFILASGVSIFWEAVNRFINPEEIQQETLGMYIMFASTIMVTLLVIFQRYAHNKTGSMIVRADSYHYVTDIFSNLLVIFSLYLATISGYEWVDPLLGALVGFYILSGAVKIGRKAFDNLMDKEFPEETLSKIEGIIMGFPQVKGFHDLKTRVSGISSFIQLHLELDGHLTLLQAHEIIDAVEKKLEHELKGAEVLIHADPAQKYGK